MKESPAYEGPVCSVPETADAPHDKDVSDNLPSLTSASA